MAKIIRIGTIKQGGRRASIYCKIEYTPRTEPRNKLVELIVRAMYKNMGRLSITGVVGPLSSGNCLGGCGQINTTLYEARHDIRHAPGWNFAKVRKFLQCWERWHLNDMRAGCEHQREAEWSDRRIDPSELPKSSANRDERGIMAMWVRPDEHADGLLTKPCPICGYKYGTSWFTEAIPQTVLDFLNSLPDADRSPAWI